MWAQLAVAMRLWGGNLGVLSLLTLAVHLPMAAVLTYVDYFVLDPGDVTTTIRLVTIAEAVFGPISAGAVLWALREIALGRRPDIAACLAVGFRRWGPLFAARLVANLLTGLALLAFIVPGLVLAVRWSLLDCAVVLEEADVGDSRGRSADLTEGRRWQIAGAFALMLVAFFAVTIVLGIPLVALGELTTVPLGMMIALDLLTDCAIGLAAVPLTVLAFAFYWDAISHDRPSDEGDSPPPLMAPASTLPPLPEAGNPYASPRAVE